VCCQVVAPEEGCADDQACAPGSVKSWYCDVCCEGWEDWPGRCEGCGAVPCRCADFYCQGCGDELFKITFDELLKSKSLHERITKSKPNRQ